MLKAYDLADLGAQCKKVGLDIGEEGAAKIYTAFKAWAAESAAMTSTPFDDMAVGFFPQVDAVVLPQIDKINGVVG